MYAFLYVTDKYEGLVVIGNPLSERENKPGVAAGRDGLMIIDLERPEAPTLALQYNDDGKLNDATAVKIGMTNSCLYAYVADGRNGLKVLQLTSADERDDTPDYMGFSPMPKPREIAHFHTQEPCIDIRKGLH